MQLVFLGTLAIFSAAIITVNVMFPPAIVDDGFCRASIPYARDNGTVTAIWNTYTTVECAYMNISLLCTRVDDDFVFTPAACVPPPAPAVAVFACAGRIYVSTYDNGRISVIDATGNVSFIPVGAEPRGIAVSPDGLFLYVASFVGEAVYVINISTGIVYPPIMIGSSVTAVAISPDSTFAYAVSYVGGFTPNISIPGIVSVIDIKTRTVSANITVGSLPTGVAISPNGTLAYVTNSGNQTVSVINITTRTVIATITVGDNPTDVAISPNGAFAYVVNSDDDSVMVINTTTNLVNDTIMVGRFYHPTVVAFSLNGIFAYVTNGNNNSVSVINTITRNVTDTIPVGVNPTGVAFSRDSSFAYVAINNSISVISTAARIVIRNITTITPWRVAVCPG